MLFATQPGLQRHVDRVAQVLIVLAEGQRAVADMGGIILEIGDRLDAATALNVQVTHGQLGADGRLGAPGAHRLQLRDGVGHLHDLGVRHTGGAA